MQGTVKWFQPRKGYGFLAGEDGNDYFVHHSQIRVEGYRTLNEGQAVTFSAGADDKGRAMAVDVTPVQQ